MALENELQQLVARFKQAESAPYSDSALLRLDKALITLINRQLMAEGPGAHELSVNYKKIALIFHTDKLDGNTDALWLETILSRGKKDGICFKTLGSCLDKLQKPEQYSRAPLFTDINNQEDLEAWLQSQKKNAGSFSTRYFYQRLLALLNQSSQYFTTTGKINPRFLKSMVTLAPVLLMSVGSLLVLEDIFALYAIYYILFKGSSALSQSKISSLKQFGETLNGYTNVTIALTSTLLAYILELVFWASTQSLHAAIEVSSRIFSLTLAAEPAVVSNAPENLSKEGGALIIRPEDHSDKYEFLVPELAAIAAPLRRYLVQNKEQSLRFFRLTGQNKGAAIELALFHLRAIDGYQNVSSGERLQCVQGILTSLMGKVEVNNGNAGLAIGLANNALNLLLSTHEQEEALEFEDDLQTEP